MEIFIIVIAYIIATLPISIPAGLAISDKLEERRNIRKIRRFFGRFRASDRVIRRIQQNYD